MRYKQSVHTVSVLFLLLFACAFLNSHALAQSADKEKPKLKDFGSSLKRIKWDSKKKAAVETKPTGDKINVADIDVVRVETTLVAGDFLILDSLGNPVRGLTRDDFKVTEDGKPQEVGMFSLGNDAAIARSIVLIMDYSGSLLPFMNTSVEAAKTLVDQLGPKDRMAIVTDDVKLLADFTKNKAELKLKLESLKKEAQKEEARRGWYKGHSLQLSALLAVLKEAFDAEDERPIIIFQTDGDEVAILRPLSSDSPSSLKKIARPFGLQDVYQAALKARATIYTVVPGLRFIGLPPDKQMEQMPGLRFIGLPPDKQMEQMKAVVEKLMLAMGNPSPIKPLPGLSEKAQEKLLKAQVKQRIKEQSALAALSTMTGGWTEFLQDPSQASEIYSRIFSDINQRYVVGYYPTNKDHDGKLRKIKVEVKGHPEYTVMRRRSYYAPGPED